MTVPYTLYDASGAIVSTGVALDATQAMGQAMGGGYVILQATDPTTEYVDTGTTTVVSRPVMSVSGNNTAADASSITADGVDELTISYVPVGAVVTIYVPAAVGVTSLAPTAIMDGVIEITTTVAGAYSLVITNSNFADFTWSFNAV